MDATQLRELISTVLIDAEMYSEDATELLMLTAAKESSLGYFIKQLGGGPALGIFQMEPNTEKDIWQNYLSFRDKKAHIVKRYDTADENDLWFNLGYQIILCRFHYMRVTESLPRHNDVWGMARYWKHHYNTIKGKGETREAVQAYQRYCL